MLGQIHHILASTIPIFQPIASMSQNIPLLPAVSLSTFPLTVEIFLKAFCMEVGKPRYYLPWLVVASSGFEGLVRTW